MSERGWAAYRRSEPHCEQLARRLEAAARTESGLRIDAVEIYEDAIKVFWSDDRPTDRDRTIARALALNDDLGTHYAARGGSHRAGPHIAGEVGVVIFQPTPPALAGLLCLQELEGTASTISLA